MFKTHWLPGLWQQCAVMEGTSVEAGRPDEEAAAGLQARDLVGMRKWGWAGVLCTHQVASSGYTTLWETPGVVLGHGLGLGRRGWSQQRA